MMVATEPRHTNLQRTLSAVDHLLDLSAVEQRTIESTAQRQLFLLDLNTKCGKIVQLKVLTFQKVGKNRQKGDAELQPISFLL